MKTTIDIPVKELEDAMRFLNVKSKRKKGITIPATDLLVAACAQTNGARLLHFDSHFDRLGSAIA